LQIISQNFTFLGQNLVALLTTILYFKRAIATRFLAMQVLVNVTLRYAVKTEPTYPITFSAWTFLATLYVSTQVV